MQTACGIIPTWQVPKHDTIQWNTAKFKQYTNPLFPLMTDTSRCQLLCMFNDRTLRLARKKNMQTNALQKFATHDQIQNQLSGNTQWPKRDWQKATCKVELLSAGVTEISVQAWHEMPFPPLFSPVSITVRLCVCVQEWMCTCVSVPKRVCQSTRQWKGVCPSVSLSVRPPRRRFVMFPSFPLYSPPIDIIKRVCQGSMRINPRETPSSLLASLSTDLLWRRHKTERSSGREIGGTGNERTENNLTSVNLSEIFMWISIQDALQ